MHFETELSASKDVQGGIQLLETALCGWAGGHTVVCGSETEPPGPPTGRAGTAP